MAVNIYDRQLTELSGHQFFFSREGIDICTHADKARVA